MSVRSFRRAHARRLVRQRRRRLLGSTRRRALVAGLTLSASGLFAATAEANTLTVMTNGDDPAGTLCGGGTACSTLRDAVSQANADAAADTITFASGLSGTITLSHGPLTITDTGGVTIDHSGAGALAVSGAGASQDFVFSLVPASSSVADSISGLTITDGDSPSAPGGAIENYNGGSNTPPLTLSNDTITGSSTADTNGGGGIYSRGPLTVTGSTISGNTATLGVGGGVKLATNAYGKYAFAIADTTVSGNTGTSGGGIASSGNLAVSNSQITGNTATSASTSRGNGAGIYTELGSLSLSGSTVSGNTATNKGGGIESITSYGTTVTGSTISGNTATAGGGVEILGEAAFLHHFAKYNPIRVSQSTITGNQATLGAGVDVGPATPGSPVTIQDSTISANAGLPSSYGGGLLVAGDITAPLAVRNSTISGNTATTGGGVSLGAAGGGAEPLLYQGLSGGGSISFENSTIASNRATRSGGGGGIYLGDYMSNGSEVSGRAGIVSTIVAGNQAAGAAQDLAQASGSTSGGFDAAFSLIQKPGTAPLLIHQAVIVGPSPKLGPLTNNGGSTKTMLPSGTSPVIDQGHAPKSLPTDQRGHPRTVDLIGFSEPPGGDGTDIGAVELSPGQVVPPIRISIKGRLVGGHKVPLLIDRVTPVVCKVRTGTLTACAIEVVTRRGKVLAGGEAVATRSTRSLSVILTPTPPGVSALERHPGGVTAWLRAVESAGSDGVDSITGRIRFTAHG